MQKEVVESVIKDCIKANFPFSTFDIIDECNERGVTDVYLICATLENHKFPLYIKQHKVSNEKVYTIYHASDFDPCEYNYYISMKMSINKDPRLKLSNMISDIAGFKAGDKLIMEVTKNSVTLSETRINKNADHVMTTTVDTYRNIRINRQYLSFIKDDVSIYIHPINKRIIISNK